MTTDRQIRANRRNAARSTGPRTVGGKAASSRNALRHGLTAQMVVLDWEHAAAFEELRRSLVDQFSPETPADKVLVEHLAGALWRLNRAGAYEAGLMAWIAHSQAEAHDCDGLALGEVFLASDRRGIDGAATNAENPDSHSTLHRRLGRTLEVAMGQRDYLTKLSRYEAHLTREVERTLNLLRWTGQSGSGLAINQRGRSPCR